MEKAPQTMQRVVVAIDPSGSGGENADLCGIVVAGLGADSNCYVLADLSGRMSPTEWARKSIDAYRIFGADRVIAEVNFGGAMVTATISAVDSGVPVKSITSSRGKVLRAEPVSALFEQGRAHLVGNFPELEDQLTSFTSDYDRAKDGSPDRLDAMVFAIAELTSGAAPGGYFNESALLINGSPDAIPAAVQRIFGVLTTSPRSGTAVAHMIFGMSPNGVPPRLHLIDWQLAELDTALSVEWLGACYRRVVEFAKEWRALLRPVIFVELDEFGSNAWDLCFVHQEMTGQGINLSKIQRRRKEAIPTLDERVESCRAKINSGAVKFMAPAFEREESFRAATANHLLTQLRKFDPAARDAAPNELVAALCMGVALWGGDADALALDNF